MAKKKDTGTKPKVVVKAKPKAVVKPEKDDNARYGVNVSKPVSSVDASRINDARKLRQEKNSKGEPYFSPYDTFMGNTEQQGYDAGENDFTTTGTGTGSGRNPLNDYTRQLQALLKGGSYADPYNSLMDQLSGLYGTAQTDLTTNKDTALTNLKSMYDTQGGNLSRINTEAGTAINTSMDNLSTFLKNQANPYADLQAQNVDSSGQLSSFLQGQGTSDQATQDYAQVLNAQNAGSDGAFNNLAGVLRSISGANQTGALADVETQRAASGRQLVNNNAMYQSQLAQGLLADQGKINTGYNQNQFDLSKGLLSDKSSAQQGATGQQNNLIQMLMTAISNGGVPKKGKLF
jgi:hypothetical protein